MQKLVELKNIKKSYNRDDGSINAIDDVTVSFSAKKLYAIMGPSGSGKSTLLNILGLIDEFDSGEYLLNGKDVKNLNDMELSNLRMEKIGFVFQDFYLDNYLNALENVCLPMLVNKKIKVEDRTKRATQLLSKFNLNDRLCHKVSELSGGEKQRIAIARALANDPYIILADEPTGNLDEESEKQVFSLLKDLSKEKCVIVVSHSNGIMEYADVVFKIKNGKLSEVKNERV